MKAARPGHGAGDAARHDRDAGIQARSGDRLLRFAGAAGEKRQDILRRRAARLTTGRRNASDSFFREYNNYMMRDLTVHEAMPGHYLQLRACERIPGADAGPRDFPERDVSSKAGPFTPSRSWRKPVTADRK